MNLRRVIVGAATGSARRPNPRPARFHTPEQHRALASGAVACREVPASHRSRRTPGEAFLGARASRPQWATGPPIVKRAGRPRSQGTSPRVVGAASVLGLTLIEMLVVLVLVSLLGTLLVQGTGFFLGKYATVKRVHRDASVAVLRQHWFISTVQAMVPSRVEARRFEGDASSFEGVTLQALAAETGLPVRARWSIEPDGASQAVVYAQEDGASWTVLAADDSEDEGLAFQYADSAGAWHRHWPAASDPANPPRERIPRMVRLISTAGRTVWLARTDLFPVPVPNHREDL